MDKQQYSIGQVSKFLNVSNELLRHYERLGLIEAERKDNGYRAYDINAVSRLQGIRRFRNMGFTLGEIEELMKDADEDRVDILLEQARIRAREAAAWQTQLEIVTGLLKQDWERRKEELDQCSLVCNDPILRFDMIRDGRIIFDEPPAGVDSWLECQPVVFLSPCFSREIIENGEGLCSFGYGVMVESYEQLHLEPVEAAVLFPARLCVHTMVCTRGSHYLDAHSLDHVKDYCTENSLRITGDAWGITVGNCMMDGMMTRWHRMFVPVEQM